jgi:hypothetical protein
LSSSWRLLRLEDLRLEDRRWRRDDDLCLRLRRLLLL